MDKYTKKDAAADTNSSGKEVSRGHHGAREDARASGELTDRPATDAGRNATKEPDAKQVNEFNKDLGLPGKETLDGKSTS